MFYYTGKDDKDYSVSVNGDIFPFKNTPLYFGIGVGAKNFHEKWKSFRRLLLGYNIHINNFSISPLVMYDIYKLKNYMTFGVGFE